MKKFFAFVLVCCLVFSSSSIAFATPTQWDTSDQTNLSNIARALTTTSTGTILRSVNDILTALTSTTQPGSLYNCAVYLYDIREYSRQIASGLNGTNGSFLEKIYNALVHTDAAGIVYSYVTEIYQKVSQIDNGVLSLVSSNNSINTNVQTLNDYFFNNFNKSYSLASWNNPLNTVNWTTYNQVTSGSIFDQLLTSLRFINNNNMGFYYKTLNAQLGVYNESHSGVNWTDNSSISYSARSLADGTFYWLSMIQAPISRLAYVHASDEEIAARQKAEDNQTAVVDNFIDSSGSGAAAPSDFGSVSDLSSGFKDNIATDASVSGIWNIFNSDNFGWFSQETANQLDTSGPASRSLRSSGSYPTPHLDQQTEDILNYLGGYNND